MKRLPKIAALLTLAALPGTALAHPGHGAGGGFVAGLLHPLTGADHLAAMLLAGAWAGIIGGRAARVLPVTLLAAMLAGFATAALVPAGLSEAMIGLSVIGLALAALLRLRPPLWLAAAGVALAGLGHGFAHGLEAPGGVARIGFVFGFLATAAALQLAGLSLVALARRVLPLHGAAWHKARR
ncbi:HupE/UreJ family protein [Sphingobium sp. H39-3-25]|uniref:HupE/UreJ family protein n=1 Tax=Sphingobium arseniciresistens TaxID=3030834 RepID=UPI0023B8DB1A|nr:HupE/UreJ family protein [Sphingobium arseniciresistens]